MFKAQSVFALIVAAGQSTRMHGQDKIFAPLAGAPLLVRTVEAFLAAPMVDQVTVILQARRLADGRQLAQDRGWPRGVHFGPGGARRQDSVRQGLEQIHGEGWVLIHDGARPLVTPALIARGLEAATSVGAAVPGIPLRDTIKIVSPADRVERTLQRDHLRAIQTPQVFRLSLIRAAHQQWAQEGRTFTDDAALLEAQGRPVLVFLGEPGNIKVTTRRDLAWAEHLWSEREGHGG